MSAASSRRGLHLPREAAALAPVLLHRGRIEALIETLIDLLDCMDADPDAEPETDGCEAEDLPAPAAWKGGRHA